MPLIFPDAEGTWLRATSGRHYLDLSAGFGTAVLGHRHPAVMEAVVALAGSPGPVFTYSAGISPVAGKVAARLCGLAGHGLTKVYFGNSGAEGIESALKFAIAATGRSAFVSFSNGYHGMTLGALSLTDAPHLTRRFSGAGVSTHMAVLGDLDRVELYLRKYEVAAVVVEIVQGMAGATSWPADRLIALAALCKKYDALLVVDEVLTGLGRTGEWFAFHHADVSPDIVVVSKALTGGMVPVCAVLMTDRVYDAVFTSQPSIHTSTFEANLLAMTVADCVTRVLEQSEVRKRIVKVSRQLRAGLDNVQLVSAGVLQKVRGVGLLLGVQISDAYQRDRELWGAAAFREELVRQGVLCHVAAGDPSVLLLLPPFTISEEEVGVAVAAFSAAASV